MMRANPVTEDVASAGDRDERGSSARLIAALTEFRQAADQGCGIDRELLLAKYADVASELRRCLDGVNFIEQLGPLLDGGRSGHAATASELAGTRLGDFHILREIGRGGMGIVYEAEQLSLGRRVAIKVLPLASMFSSQQLTRFQNEARAAATLDHPNIVSAYSIGCERDVHFYAMQLVHGDSLAEALRQLQRKGQQSSDLEISTLGAAGEPTAVAAVPGAVSRRPNVEEIACPTALADRPREYFRAVADVIAQAAEALAHAHNRGVVHRDIKPANLLLGPGRHVWITDFGLAHLEADGNVTMTGDLVGTLRYMSPEQALGKRSAIDHRVDVYGLGATLYELLTLRPLVMGNDRQELIQRIATAEPVRPRTLHRAIPRDLETIVLKAVEKLPTDRYATAQDMADDLRRFVDDRPILAHRPTLLDRAAKWSRRHRGVAIAAAAALLLASGSLLVHNVRIARERSEAERQRDRADTNFSRSREVVDRVLRRAADELGNIPHTDDVRRTVLQDAMEFYQGFLTQFGDDRQARFDAALAYRQMGRIALDLRETELAERHARESVALLAELAREFPDRQEYQEELDLSVRLVPSAFRIFVDPAEDARHDDARLQLAQRLVDHYPSVPYFLDRLAQTAADVGNSLREAGRREEAEQLLRRSLALRGERAAKFRDLPPDRNGLAHSHHWLAAAVVDRDERRRHLERALELHREQTIAEPNDSFALRGYAHVLEYLAAWNRERGKLSIAEAQCREAIDVLERWLAQSPAGTQELELSEQQRNIEFHRRLAWSYWQLSQALSLQVGREADLETAHSRSIEQWELVAAAEPDNAAFRSELSRRYQAFAEFLCRRADVEQRDLERALQYAKLATQTDPDNRDAWTTLAEIRRARGER